MDRETVTSRVYEEYHSGQYARGLQEIDTLSPEQQETGEISFFKLRLLSLAGRVDDALLFLGQLAGRKIWLDPKLMQDDIDLSSLRASAEFSRLCTEHRELKETAPSNGRSPEIVYPSDGGPYPLLLVLHGNQQNAAETLPRWKSAADEGWMVAALQSNESGYGAGSYVWNDYRLARRQAEDFLREHRDAWNGTLVLGGFSRGARTALTMALEGAVSTAGVMAVCPAELHDVPAWTVDVAATPVRATVFLGAEDPYTRESEELERCLTSTGSEVTYRMIDGMGHAYPEDFSSRLAKMMRKIPKS